MSVRPRMLLLGLMAALAWPTGATNRLQNPSFNGIRGWTAVPPNLASYDAAVGVTGGSARLTLPVGAEGDIRQCLSVSPAAVYDFQVSCMGEPAGEFPSGCGFGFGSEFYAGSACDGEELTTNYTPTHQGGGWRVATLRISTLPATHSVMVRLWGSNPYGPSTHTLHFDNAVVDPLVKGDLDNDDHTDLLLRQAPPSNNFSIWQMSDTTRLQEWSLAPQQQDPFTNLVGVGEFTGDYYSDLVFQKASTGSITLWRMLGPYRLGEPLAFDTLPPSNQWRVSATGRFKTTSMGPPRVTDDLVLRNLSTNALQVWFTQNDGVSLDGVVVPTPDHATDSNWTLVAGGDFNQDNHGDFLWYNETTGKIVTWYMDRFLVRISGQFTNPDSAGGAGWRVVAAGDYGMGTSGIESTPDIVWRNSSSGKLVVWHMDAASNRTDGLFTTPDAPNQPLTWNVVGPR